MNEAEFSAAYLKKWRTANPGSRFHRIHDGIQGFSPEGDPYSNKNPFDHFGVTAPSGQAIAWEFKFMNGGATFIVGTHFKKRMHQLYHLRQFAEAGGIALVVLGWIPNKARRSITLEWPISEIDDDSRIPLTRPTH
jgi:hypothetical protein